MEFKTKADRDKFILDNEILIKKVIKDNPLFQWNNSEDLYQVAWENLIKCVDRYEELPNGVKFSTYAYNSIRWTLINFIDDYRNNDYIYLKSTDKKEKNPALNLDIVTVLEDGGYSDRDFEGEWRTDKTIDIQKDCELKELQDKFFEGLFCEKKKLKPKARKILELYFVKDLSLTKIGEILGCSKQAVKNCVDFHRHRVIRKLKAEGII